MWHPHFQRVFPDLIIPAREGTLRVLRTTREAGVNRVVMTSSSVAITDGKRPQTVPFTEKDWTSLDRYVGTMPNRKPWRNGRPGIS